MPPHCACPSPAAYDVANGGQPVYNTWLVGRSVATGNVVWARSTAASGWSQLPVSRPTVHLSVAAVATGGQAVLLDAASGQTRFQYDAGGWVAGSVFVRGGEAGGEAHWRRSVAGQWIQSSAG